MRRVVQRVPTVRPRRGRTATRHRFTRTLQGIVSVLCAAGILAGIYYGTRVSYGQITDVVVIGGETISHNEIEGLVQRELAGTYGGLIPRRFFYTYPQERILAQVRTVPLVKDARVFLQDRHTVRVEFSEYTPFALWCGEEAARPAGALPADTPPAQPPCFFIDDAGYAFAESPVVRGALYTRFSRASTTPAYAARFDPAPLIGEMVSLRARLRDETGLGIVRVAVQNADDATLYTASGAEIKIRTQDTATHVYDTLLQIFHTDTYAYLLRDGFKSIDIRFGNRVYVKDMKAVETEQATTTATSTGQGIGER